MTILSRCQRFDLRRVEPPVIVANLEQIAAAEGAKIEAEGLLLIARAAEGSVRDAQSLLDQAIVQVDRGQTVTAAAIRDMLGLADRAQTIALFEETARGKAAAEMAIIRLCHAADLPGPEEALKALQKGQPVPRAVRRAAWSLGMPSDSGPSALARAAP